MWIAIIFITIQVLALLFLRRNKAKRYDKHSEEKQRKVIFWFLFIILCVLSYVSGHITSGFADYKWVPQLCGLIILGLFVHCFAKEGKIAIITIIIAIYFTGYFTLI